MITSSEFKLIFIDFMKTKNYELDFSEDMDEDIRFYFNYDKNPIDIEIILSYEQSKTRIWFQSSTGVPSINEFVSGNLLPSKPLLITNTSSIDMIKNYLEESFNFIEKIHTTTIIPNLCEWYLEKFNDKYEFEYNNSYFRLAPEELEGLFRKCDMIDEYIEWATTLNIQYMLPKNVQDIFIF